MNDDQLIDEWAAQRRESAPLAEPTLGKEVMARIRETTTPPSWADSTEAVNRASFSGGRPAWVYFGGSALAGAFRMIAIFYLIFGTC